MKIYTLDISLRALCILPVLALGACDPKLKIGLLDGEPPADGQSTGEDTDPADADTDPVDADTGPVDADTGPVDADTDPVDEDPDPVDDTTDPVDDTTDPVDDTTTGDSGEPPVGCDPWAQDCPGANQKCVPYAEDGGSTWNALTCVEIDPAPVPVGSPCISSGSLADPADNCEKGAFCWNVDLDTQMGTCVAQCQGSEAEPVCGADTSCLIFNGGVLNLCLADCDPLAPECEAGEVCIVAGTDVPGSCVDDQSGEEGQVFDPCEYLNACDPGLMCANSAVATECDPQSQGCCLPFCDLTAPNTCPGDNLSCVAFYAEGEAPSGHENLGLCSLAD